MIRVFRHYISSAYLLLVIFEGLVYLSAVPFAYWIRLGMTEGWDDATALRASSLIYTVVMLTTAASLGFYQRSLSQDLSVQTLRMTMVFGIATLAMAVMFYSFPGIFLGRGVLLGTILYSAIGVAFVRFLFIRYVDTEAIQRRVLVLGAGEKASQIEDYSKLNKHAGFRVIGYVSPNTDTHNISEERVIHQYDSLYKIVKNLDVDELVIALDDERMQIPVDDILACKMDGLAVIDFMCFLKSIRVKSALIECDQVGCICQTGFVLMALFEPLNALLTWLQVCC